MVYIHDTGSSWHNVTSGIPHGIVLGCELFLFYVNDLPVNVALNVYMFDDDSNIFHRIISQEDTTILQKDFDCLQSWSAKWLLNFHLHR